MTTITYRDGVVAADSVVTSYETEWQGAQPASRSYMRKLEVRQLDAFWRLAIASSGEAIDGVTIERAITRRLKIITQSGVDITEFDSGAEAASAARAHNFLTREDMDCWDTEIEKAELQDPDNEHGAVIILRDLRVQRYDVWCLQDYRVVRRVRSDEFVACGSDSPMALAAMQCGADAVKAVWVAAKYGAYTGGPVHNANAARMILNTSQRPPWDTP